MRFLANIRVRLTLWYLLVVLVLIAFFGGTAYILLGDTLSKKNIAPWDMRLAQVQIQADGSQRITGFTDVAGQVGFYGSTIKVQGYTVAELQKLTDAQGITTVRVLGTVVSVPASELLDTTIPAGTVWFYVTPDGLGHDILVVNQSAIGVNDLLDTFRKAMLITAIVTLVLAGLLGFFLVSRLLRPVQAITRTARQIGEKDLDRRLEVKGNDELAGLSATLNQMFARLEAAFVREREFTADASHELRTPLAIAQGEATLALREPRSPEEYQKALEAVSRQISRMSSLINRLLFLARSDDRLELTMADVDLASLLTEVAADAQVLCEQKGLTLRTHVAGNVRVRSDVTRLRELFLNLLDNAVHYTPRGGTVSISLKTAGDEAVVAVADTGIGIAEEHLSHIFDRFYRVDKSRARSDGGAGLGLAISRRIAEVHGGRIEVQSKVGQGSTFTVALPLITAAG